MSNVVAELRGLSDIINGAIDRIEEQLTARSIMFPSLASLYTQESEEARNIPEVFRDANLIVAASTQLAATARSPPMSMLQNAYTFLQGTALRAAFQADVAEYLREHGPSVKFVLLFTQPSHLNIVQPAGDIAQKRHLDPYKLTRLLRLLATHHVFTEVQPGIFANNRLSCMLDSGSSTDEIISNPAAKDRGFSAFLGMTLEYSARTTESLLDVLFSPETACSGGLQDTALAKAYGFDGTFFQFIEAPGNERHGWRFTEAMKGLTSLVNRDAVVEAFDWHTLPESSLIIDVGGGNASQTAILAHKLPSARFIVQDRKATLRSARELLAHEGLSEALKSGKIELQEHDFFTRQPIRNASIFFLRHILHDWSDEDGVKILQNLRISAGVNTRLIVQDQVIMPACNDAVQEELSHSVPVPPEPVLSNWGQANSYAYFMDMQMMNVYQSAERTLVQWRKLLADGGWKLVDLRFGSRPFAITNQAMIAVLA